MCNSDYLSLLSSAYKQFGGSVYLLPPTWNSKLTAFTAAVIQELFTGCQALRRIFERPRRTEVREAVLHWFSCKWIEHLEIFVQFCTVFFLFFFTLCFRSNLDQFCLVGEGVRIPCTRQAWINILLTDSTLQSEHSDFIGVNTAIPFHSILSGERGFDVRLHFIFTEAV